MLDVVVVGAGLSGLQAALSFRQAGLTVKVIEARDRVGGKTLSVPCSDGRGYADLGAAWLNNNTQVCYILKPIGVLKSHCNACIFSNIY